MPHGREYDEVVNRWSRASVGLFGLALVGLLITGVAQAQIHAAPPSVTSMGFGGRAINGPAPSVTSVGPRGFTFNPAFPSSRPLFGTSSTPGFGGHGPHHRPRHPQDSVGYFGVPYYGYYDNGYYDNGPDAQNYAPAEGNNAGPTVFDQRGGYIAPAPAERPNDASSPAAPSEAAADSPPTVLVFKDGHQLELENYAIVGTTLYDLTEGHRRKISLSDLDLTATSQQNDDRGVDFHLPAGAEAN
jgi:hypothetical protein